MGTLSLRALFGVAALVALAAAPRGREPGRASTAVALAGAAALSCPAGGRVLPAGTALQTVVDDVEPGSVLCLSPGSYPSPVEIHTRLTLVGPAEATIRSGGSGTTVRVLADSVVLAGFTVDGSGRRYDKMDAGVYLRGHGVEVRGLTVRDALFGIVVEQSRGATIADNRVFGLADLPVGIRGDGIRLWEVRGSLVEGNHLEDSRDILVWYSPGNRIAHNTVERSRYATHFMYSDDCLVEDADYRDNIVGVFVMYSRGTTLRDNRISDNVSVDGLGLGVKESGNLVVEGNRFLRTRDCLYLETSPFRQGDSVLVRDNTFAGCDTGVTFHSSARRNSFVANAFQANQTNVAVEGRGNARDVVWRGNYFDDYQGYDLDGDGVGDVAYEVRSLSERLVASHPELAFFRGTIALELLDVAARVLPLLQPETLLTDPQPRMSPPGKA
ncbi:MAG TPA: nitrous oxide reductase family maturation protein NosD [Longimicrobiales bacterium]|nr:nitrous oxide reductase family maturation protein NosD [Longimicrobiales bacterium]